VSEKKQFRAIKGTRDILPPDSSLWNWFERQARETFEVYGFRDIRTPIFEETSLFARSIGGETDVVSKEMYTFVDPPLDLKQVSKITLMQPSGDQVQVSSEVSPGIGRLSDLLPRDVLSLRPECTASVVRAYIEHGMQTLPGNVKLYYSGPMFRRERPQKGRYRQFYQMGAEVLGQSDAPGIDAEVIEMLVVLFRRVGLEKITLYVNSIGCKECRPKYVELLREELRKVKDQLGADSQRRIETNPLRVLDSKIPDEQPIIEKLPRISDHLCEDCRAHFANLKDELALREVTFEENWRLVRGLDYYTRTTFEVTAAGLGSQNAVCGGGRYDGLIELLGGPPTKGIGFAIGTDRAILSIQESGKLPRLPGLAVFIAWMGEKSYPTAVNIARKLRQGGLIVELPAKELKFRKALELADKLGAKYALILGEDEIANSVYALKRLADANQQKLAEADLLEYLESERRGA
jgi:histidyl-tRNA synthetase